MQGNILLHGVPGEGLAGAQARLQTAKLSGGGGRPWGQGCRQKLRQAVSREPREDAPTTEDESQVCGESFQHPWALDCMWFWGRWGSVERLSFVGLAKPSVNRPTFGCFFFFVLPFVYCFMCLCCLVFALLLFSCSVCHIYLIVG